MTDLSGVLVTQLQKSIADKVQADAATTQKQAAKLAKQLDATIRGTGQHTLMFASGGVGAVLGGIAVEIARAVLAHL